MEQTTSTCCVVSRGEHGATARQPQTTGTYGSTDDMALIGGGSFLVGTDEPTFPADGEGPAREVEVGPFWIDRRAVSNAQFAAFVDATGYVTEPETFGWSFVFYGFLPDGFPPTRAVQAAPWWRQVQGACWRHPEGPHAAADDRLGHPAVHISWNDAVAYADWLGRRLPTEAEWEVAARGGLVGKRFPWGDRLVDGKKHRCNVWQGTFPTHNTGKDGHLGTAPVDAFEPNGYGLFNMTGNTWEWCADWFGTSHADGYKNPQGPASGPGKVMKGGSYLCHASYCNRYRVAARTFNTPDSSSGHMGFRLVRDA